MRFSSLPEWLHWQENLHFTEVDPGLDRLGQVWQAMGGTSKLPFTVITVAGTNGKGSSVAMLASILQAAGYQTGTYTSPHLLEYNERICIDGQPCSDEEICQAFARIDEKRDHVSLTYFEFATLAAVDIFCQKQCDVVVLEVGMGGRLDAVNLFDTDIALITPISLDHTNWLGNNREKIATEKAGIMRAKQPVVCSENAPANSILDHATSLDAPCFIAEKDFFTEKLNTSWSWHNSEQRYDDLPLPALLGSYQLQNAAAVLQVVNLLNQAEFSISTSAIKSGLQQVKLAGRFQVIEGNIERVFDVTHNHQGACNLAKLLTERDSKGKTHAVLAMLQDKDANAVVEPLKGVIENWYIAGLNSSRGMSGEDLANKINSHIADKTMSTYETVEHAYQHAMESAQPGDCVLVFGSFQTVEAVMRCIPEHFKFKEK